MIGSMMMCASAVILLVGMLGGIVMGIQQNFALGPAHAHLNLIGGVLLFLFGLYYRLVPNAGKGTLAKVQGWLHIIGAIPPAGAPYYFAQVMFNEVKPENYFLGGMPLEDDQIFVHGTIRDGRPMELKDKLVARLTTDVASASGIERNCVWIYVSELPPSQMVEFGRTLPLHGKEAEWSADPP
jgi:phenylpyruvate tautomerase PptA (4-oxalocrotonate tautomerase family)